MIYPGSVSGDPLNHSVQESMIHPRRVRPHKRQQLIDHSCSLLSLHQSLIVGWGGGGICIFNAKRAELLLHMLTTNQFHYSVFCLQLEEMLDKMSKINRACESGCQSSPADGHFMNSSESGYVWQLSMYTLCYSWGNWEKVRVCYTAEC